MVPSYRNQSVDLQGKWKAGLALQREEGVGRYLGMTLTRNRNQVACMVAQ